MKRAKKPNAAVMPDGVGMYNNIQTDEIIRAFENSAKAVAAMVIENMQHHHCPQHESMVTGMVKFEKDIESIKADIKDSREDTKQLIATVRALAEEITKNRREDKEQSQVEREKDREQAASDRSAFKELNTKFEAHLQDKSHVTSFYLAIIVLVAGVFTSTFGFVSLFAARYFGIIH